MKANKKNYMPGGGMLRNKYANGGAVYGFGMSRGQGAAALASRPSVKPASPVSRDMVMKFNPENLDPREMADRFAKTGGGPIDEVTDIMFRSGMPIRYGDRFLTSSNRDITETPMSPGESRPTATTLTTATPTTAKTTSPASAPTVKPVSPVKGGSMTFGEAFAAARKQGAKEFEYKGKKYNTMLKGEGVKQTQPAAQRSSETIRPMPSKVATEVGGKYFESPTGKMAYTPGKSTTANVAAAPMRTASSVSSSASTPPQIRTTMSAAEKEDKKPMSSAARAMMARYMSKYKK